MPENPISNQVGDANANADQTPEAAGKNADSGPHPTENTIRPSRRRTQKADAVLPKASSSEAARGKRHERQRRTAGRQIPDHVRKRFVQVGHRYYFSDGAHAFTDRGTRLVTTSENTEVIKSLIAIAETRGWGEITVSGTERFRKEAWAAASAAGLGVRGYTPTEMERAQFARRIQRAAPGRGDGLKESRSPPAERFSGRHGNDAGRARGRRQELILGRLIDHGVAPYRHDPHEAMSYFVKIETVEGQRKIWGVDLQRALKQSLSQVKKGDEIGLRAVRSDSVTIQTSKRDPEGRVVGQEPLDAHRNHWIVERREFLEERAAAARAVRDSTVDPKRAAQRHPELVGTYLQMHAAEIAARQFRDPEDRAKFVSRLRSALADAVARGEPLPAVRLRERAAAAKPTPPTPPSPAREEAPAR